MTTVGLYPVFFLSSPAFVSALSFSYLASALQSSLSPVVVLSSPCLCLCRAFKFRIFSYGRQSRQTKSGQGSKKDGLVLGLKT